MGGAEVVKFACHVTIIGCTASYNTTHIPDDHNRVILSPLEYYTNCQGDFVNACYIDVRHYKMLKLHFWLIKVEPCFYRVIHNHKNSSPRKVGCLMCVLH